MRELAVVRGMVVVVAEGNGVHDLVKHGIDADVQLEAAERRDQLTIELGDRCRAQQICSILHATIARNLSTFSPE
jgi:hypothetical protein